MRCMTTSIFIDDTALATHYAAHITALHKRHDLALEAAGAGHAIIFSGAPIPVFLDDYYYSFKANPHFVSWLPLIKLPYSYLIYTPGEKTVLVYYQEQDYWHSPPEDPQGYWTPYFDIRVIREPGQAAQFIPEAREKCIFIGELQDPSPAMGIERVNPNTAMNILHYGRGVKSDYEIECMRQASMRAAVGHVAAEKAFRAGKSEFDIHMSYCATVGHDETELPYGSIVGVNQNGAVLHYQHRAIQPAPKPLSLLIDAGAQIHRYASDITRTYAFAEGEFADLISAFEALQLGLVAEVSAGVDYADLHLLTHRKIAKFLKDHDIATGSEDALVDEGVTAAFFPHGLGHLLGVQVHDVGGFMADSTGKIIERPSDHATLRLTRPLQTNMVLTIEPGLYIIDLLLQKMTGLAGDKLINHSVVDHLRPYGGIRIEDNVRITDSGCENLTRDAFAKLL